MAELGVTTKPYLSVNAVNLSAWLRSLEVNEEVETQDDTVSGDTARSHAPGLRVNRLRAVFNQDYAAGGPDATLAGAEGTIVAVEWRPSTDPVSASNPKRTGNALITRYRPVGQTVGELATCEVEMVGVGTWTRATA